MARKKKEAVAETIKKEVSIAKPVAEITNQTTLAKYLKLICLSKFAENKEALLDIKKDSVLSLVKSPNGNLALRASFKGSIVEKDLGEVGVTNLPSLVKFLDSFQDTEVKLAFFANTLSLSSKDTVITVPIQNADYIVNKPDIDRFEKLLKESQEVSLELDTETVNKIITKYNLLNSDELVLTIKKGGVYISLKSQLEHAELTAKIKEVNDKDLDIKIIISKTLVAILSTINDSVTLRLASKNQRVLNVNYSATDLEIDYLLALNAEKEE